jgi:hypothetical protein
MILNNNGGLEQGVRALQQMLADFSAPQNEGALGTNSAVSNGENGLESLLEQVLSALRSELTERTTDTTKKKNKKIPDSPGDNGPSQPPAAVQDDCFVDSD